MIFYGVLQFSCNCSLRWGWEYVSEDNFWQTTWLKCSLRDYRGREKMMAQKIRNSSWIVCFRTYSKWSGSRNFVSSWPDSHVYSINLVNECMESSVGYWPTTATVTIPNNEAARMKFRESKCEASTEKSRPLFSIIFQLAIAILYLFVTAASPHTTIPISYGRNGRAPAYMR